MSCSDYQLIVELDHYAIRRAHVAKMLMIKRKPSMHRRSHLEVLMDKNNEADHNEFLTRLDSPAHLPR